jgi:hypothetical protein
VPLRTLTLLRPHTLTPQVERFIVAAGSLSHLGPSVGGPLRKNWMRHGRQQQKNKGRNRPPSARELWRSERVGGAGRRPSNLAAVGEAHGGSLSSSRLRRKDGHFFVVPYIHKTNGKRERALPLYFGANEYKAVSEYRHSGNVTRGVVSSKLQAPLPSSLLCSCSTHLSHAACIFALPGRKWFRDGADVGSAWDGRSKHPA